MSITLNGNISETTHLGLKTVSWTDDPKHVRYISHKNDRKLWLRAIVVHTHLGILGKQLIPGYGPDTNLDWLLNKYQVDTTRAVSWDYTVDCNGDVLVQSDPLKHFSWQATNVNPITCGIEMIQKDNTGSLYEGQIEKTVLLIDYLTAKLGIQRQIPWDKKNNKPYTKIIKRLRPFSEKGGHNGVNVVGIYAHFQQTDQRGPGDPGPWIFYALRDAGYELFDFQNNEDILVWEERQKKLLGFNDHDSDGIPGKQTQDAIKEVLKKKQGMYVQRPIDNII